MNGNHSRPVGRSAQPRRCLVVLAVTAAVLGGLVGCGDDGGGAGDGRPIVVATHSLLGDLVTNVVGEQAEVEVIMPVGVDPHDFEPSAADVARLSEADLVVANGLGFEEGLLDALDAAGSTGVTVLELGEGLDPLPLGDEPGVEDPHWFTDPQRMARAAGLVADAAAGVEGVDAAAVARQADAYAGELQAADAAIAGSFAAIPEEHRTLVTSHDVLGYFADRYGFAVVGTVVPSGTTLAEPSAAELSDLVGVIEAAGVPAVFADTSSSRELADVLAEEAGDDIEVVELYTESLGDAGSGAATYLGLIATNAQRIVDALA